MYHPRHARPHRFVQVAAVAVLVVAVLGVALALEPETAGPPRPKVTEAVSPTTAEPAASEGPGALDRCRSQYDAQAPVLRRAARSIAQWEGHVVAMNRLVDGEITLAQASTFWARTRVGAQDRIDDYRLADSDYATRAHDCPGPQAVDTDALRTCTRSVGLRGEVNAVARRTIGTWAAHVRDMERLRTGQLSPSRALHLWHLNWQKGQRQIDAYHAAVRAAESGDGCLA